MPSWSIHLAIAKEVNKILKLDKDLFYFGNLIPDVDWGTSINRYQAHFYNDKKRYQKCKSEIMIDIEAFIKCYKNDLKNDLILGYLSHLLADSFYNEFVYTNAWVQDNNDNVVGIKFNNGKIKKIDINDKKREKRKYKHYDLELYGKYLFKDGFVNLPTNKKVVLDNVKI